MSRNSLKFWFLLVLITRPCVAAEAQGPRELIIPKASPLALNRFVVYATKRVTLGSEDSSSGGDIGVATTGTTSPELTVGSMDHFDPLHALYSPSVLLGKHAVVGAIYTNSLTNDGGRFISQSPYPAMPALPQIFPATPGGADITVAAGTSTTLNPGNYGVLTDNGIVRLTPGVYSFASVGLGNNAKLFAQGAGSTRILVLGSFATGEFTQILPLGQFAREITISVSGSDGSGGSIPAVSIGADSQIVSLLAAPNGTVSFGDRVRAKGAFAGANVVAGKKVELAFQSGFPVETPKIGAFVAYGGRSVTLGRGDHSLGGDIGVASTAVSSFGTQLKVGSEDFLDPFRILFAPSVSLGNHTHVSGDVEANSLQNNGAFFLGSQAPFPSAAMPPLPLAAAGAAGTSNITAAAGQVTELTPGGYASLNANGSVHLAPGAYVFTNVTLGDHARLIALPGGFTTIVITGGLSIGQSVEVFPRALRARALTIYVEGNDGTGGNAPAASVGADSHIVCLLAVPHGTLSLGNNVRAIGAFMGFDIAAADRVTLQFQSGFPISTPSGQQALTGAVPGAQAAAPLVGPVPGNTTLHFGLQLPIQNSSALAALAQQLYDPSSPQYRRFLPPAQFTASFGATSAQYGELVAFAQSHGLTIGATHGNNLFLELSGTVANIENALLVNMNYYQRSGGGQFFSPDRAASINPSGLSLLPASVVGLNNFNLPQNSIVTVPSARSTLTNIGSGPNGFLFGYDFRNIYIPDTTLTGTGQTVALVEFDDFFSSDITQYENTASPALPNVPVQRVPVMGGAGTLTGNNIEVALDIEMAIAMAPGLDGVFVYEAPSSAVTANPFDQTAYDMEAAAVFNTIASPPTGIPLSKQISSSWDDFDGPSVTPALVEFATQGQSFFSASGDFGAYVMGDPISSPLAPYNDGAANLMTTVGGTQSASGTGTPTSCMVETTWNDPSEYSKGASGGGISTNISNSADLSMIGLPAYQTSALATAENNGSGTDRNIPDVSALADGIFIVWNNGSSGAAGGTSAAAPLWAGFTALVNQQDETNGMSVGFLNPALYRIAQGANYTNDFHDINDGSNNNEVGDATHFAAVPGFDLATGWGSPSLGLLNDLASPAPAIPPITFDQVIYTILTGGDDLRCTSSATADLLDSGGNLIHETTLKAQGASSWDDSTTHTVTDSIPSQSRTSVAAVKINLIQHSDSCQIATTGDNWNINGLQVQFSNPGPPVITSLTMVNLTGNPLVRLTQSNGSASFTTIYDCP